MPLTYSPEHLSTRDRAGRRLSPLVGSDPWVQRDSGAVPRRAHNPEVPGANPGPATRYRKGRQSGDPGQGLSDEARFRLINGPGTLHYTSTRRRT